MDKYQFFIELIQFIISPILTLLAGYFGVKYGLKLFKEQKKIEIIQEQLNKFYSPLLGLRKEILAKSELRLKIQKAGDEIWKQKVSENNADIDTVHKEIEYNNKQLKEKLIPLYNKMLDIFRENYWLAEPETKEFYPKLLEFVEIWNRWLGGGISAEIIQKIGHTEDNVKSFYDELENRMEILIKSIKE